jgi:hypothetical protein
MMMMNPMNENTELKKQHRSYDVYDVIFVLSLSLSIIHLFL